MAQAESTKELTSVLWDGANILRGKMDANEYKNYLLGIVFYKYLSDTYLTRAYDLLNDEDPETMRQAQEAYEEAYNGEDGPDLKAELKAEFHYIIDPELTYTKMAQKAEENHFQREDLQKAFNSIEQADTQFAGLFSDIDLYSTRLGVNDTRQAKTVSDLVMAVDKADILSREGDVLGDAYEYMIGQFVSETGKKAGEFYTPRNPGVLADRICMLGHEDIQGLSVYDPAMGSGSLMLNIRKYSNHPEYIRYYGQELMQTTYNLARMNLMLHGVQPDNQKLHNADTLDADWPTDEENVFDTVVMNPPYSANWSANSGFLLDPRFSSYGVLPPKSKADYAFLLHGFYHLKQSGTMAIFLPHGVLFRGGAEGTIRKKLLEDGSIDAVIGLAPNLFYNTSIPVCIVVLKKNRSGRDVLFIDASKQFNKGKNQNILTEEHVDHIVQIYKDRKDVDKESHLAKYEEIEANDFNLNIPRYVDTFEKEEEIDINEVFEALKNNDSEIAAASTELNKAFEELGLKVRL